MKYLFTFLLLSSLLLSKNLEKVDLYLKWKHQFQFAGFYIAKEKGFYNDIGLDVNIVEASGNESVVDKVLMNKSSFAISDSSLIKNVIKGEELSLIMAILQESPFIFLFLKESNIKYPNDFEGKRIMLDLNSKDNAFVKLFLDRFGLEKNKMKIIPTSYNINDLITKKVDVFNAYITNEPYILEKKGLAYNYIKPSSIGMNFYGDILFTSQENERKNPIRIKEFFDATMKGWRYAFEHIDETIKLILKKYNTQNETYDKYLFEANHLKDLSGIDEGKFGRLELDKINYIVNSYFLINQDISIETINKLDVNSITNDRFYLDYTSFSKKEINYLKSKEKLIFCVDTNTAPFIFYENGQYKGISIDYLKLIEKKINKKIELKKTKNWLECNKLLKKGEVDLTPLVFNKSEIFEHLHHSTPYIEGYLVLATKISEPYLQDKEQLNNKVIGISKYTKSLDNYIKEYFPTVKLLEIDGGIEDGLKLVKDGKIYGFLGLSDMVSYEIQKDFPFELKIMRRFGGIEEGSIGITEQNATLVSIIDKTIRAIGKDGIRKIRNNWTLVKEEGTINYTYLLNTFFILILLFLAFLYKQYLLHKSNLELKLKVKEQLDKNRKKDKILFQQLKLASMGEMLNNIAHQWRQPLNVINSNVAVIDSIFVKHKIQDITLENTLTQIENQTKYMSDTIESFRTFFSPSKEEQEFLLSEAVEYALRIVKFDFEMSGIKTNVQIEKDLKVRGYLGEYIQTLIVILNNSKDAFLENKIENPKIDIYINKLLLVDDNAGGISEEIIDRVFEPYFTTKYKDKGTGTGLYMAKMIIENSMNGALGVTKIEGGTRFKIEI